MNLLQELGWNVVQTLERWVGFFTPNRKAKQTPVSGHMVQTHTARFPPLNSLGLTPEQVVELTSPPGLHHRGDLPSLGDERKLHVLSLTEPEINSIHAAANLLRGSIPIPVGNGTTIVQIHRRGPLHKWCCHYGPTLQRLSERIAMLDNPYPGLADDPELRALADEIGRGLALLTPFNGNNPKLVQVPFGDRPHCPERRVSWEIAGRARRSPVFHRLSEHREGQRLGWRELGLPGEEGELYCLTQ